MNLSELVEGAIVFANVVFTQVFDGLSVVHAHERLLWRDEVGVQFVYKAAKLGFQDAIANINNEILELVQQVFKGNKRTFCLHVSVPRNDT